MRDVCRSNICFDKTLRKKIDRVHDNERRPEDVRLRGDAFYGVVHGNENNTVNKEGRQFFLAAFFVAVLYEVLMCLALRRRFWTF